MDPEAAQHFARVKPEGFFAIQWTGTGIALCLLIFRLGVRWRMFRSLRVDDYLVAFAWICLFASSVFWHFQLEGAYIFHAWPAVKAGRIVLDTDAEQTEQKVASFLKALFAFYLLFYTCLWAVKFSFLIFFNWLGSGSHQYCKYWWSVVTVFTIGTYLATIADFPYHCSFYNFERIDAYCSARAGERVVEAATRVNTAFDIVTDALILSIPIRLLRGVAIPLRQKLSLYALFSLTIVTMAIALIRLLLIPDGQIGADFTWTFSWSNIEMAVCIIVACLGSFRQLYVEHSKLQHEKRMTGNNRSHNTFQELRERSNGGEGGLTALPLRGINVTFNIEQSFTENKKVGGVAEPTRVHIARKEME